MARHSIRLGGICVVMMGTVTAPAHAQALDDKYWVEVGAYWPSVSSHVRVAPASNPDGGTNIDLESDLKQTNQFHLGRPVLVMALIMCVAGIALFAAIATRAV